MLEPAAPLLGKESKRDLPGMLREIGNVLGSDVNGYNSDEGAKNAYRTALKDKAALIVIDDVWSVVELEPFLAESPRSRILFTTRDASIANAVGADIVTAELLGEQESWEVLARWSGYKAAQRPGEASAIIEHCGRLPLALAMVGAMLRNKPATYWKHVLKVLESADFAKIKQEVQNYPYDLMRAIQVSVDALESQLRESYLKLAVTTEDMSISPVIQQLLWNADEGDAVWTAEELASHSLATQDENGAIRLHDLQLDYLGAVYSDQDALRIIRAAVRLSSHTTDADPRQFASQIVGRLMYPEFPEAVLTFASSIASAVRYPWLRPLKPTLHPPGTALLRTLRGHTARTVSLAITPDGKCIVSASHDQTLRVWRLDTGRPIRTMNGDAPLLCVAVSPDGRAAVCGAANNVIKVWDLETGAEVHTLHGHTGTVNAVAISGDGRRAVSGSGDNTLKIWNLDTGRELSTLSGHTGPINGLALTPDGRAVSASADKTLRVWDLKTGKEIRVLPAHRESIRAVSVTPDGKYAFSAAWDHLIGIWDLEAGRDIAVLKGHEFYVEAVVVSRDVRRAVSASWGKTVRVWDLEAGTHRKLEGHSFFLSAVALNPDGRWAVSSDWHGEIKVWDLDNVHEVKHTKAHEDCVTSLAVDRSGRLAITGSSDETLKIWSLESLAGTRTIQAGHRVDRLAMDSDGRIAISALSGVNAPNAVQIWDVTTGDKIGELAGHTGQVQAVALSLDGRLAVSAAWDRTIKMWDVPARREIRTLTGHAHGVQAIVIMADAVRAATAHEDGMLRLWDLQSGRELGIIGRHSTQVLNVALAGQERWAISASFDPALKIWDIETGQEIGELVANSRRINEVAVSPDGRHAVSASGDGAVKIWDLGTQRLIAEFTAEAGSYCCSFADDHTILSGDTSGNLHFLAFEIGNFL